MIVVHVVFLSMGQPHNSDSRLRRGRSGHDSANSWRALHSDDTRRRVPLDFQKSCSLLVKKYHPPEMS